MIGGATRLCVLLGDPVTHSRSPAMLNAAFSARHIDAVFTAWALKANSLGPAVKTLGAISALGASVTVPHKQAIISFADARSPLVAALGCANCLVIRQGRVEAENTDVFGFGESLRRQLRLQSTRPVVVLGAGGAARAVVAALDERGFKHIAVVNRSAQRRRAFEKFARAFPAVSVHAWPSLAELLPEARLVVHATSAEVKHEPLSVPLHLLTKNAAVVDLTYGQTALVTAAKKRGLRAHDGSQMLLYQAMRAFHLWTGKEAPKAAMARALLS